MIFFIFCKQKIVHSMHMSHPPLLIQQGAFPLPMFLLILYFYPYELLDFFLPVDPFSAVLGLIVINFTILSIITGSPFLRRSSR